MLKEMDRKDLFLDFGIKGFGRPEMLKVRTLTAAFTVGSGSLLAFSLLASAALLIATAPLPLPCACLFRIGFAHIPTPH
jgi:hypothetical protein